VTGFITACLRSDDKFIMSEINYGILARCYSVIARNQGRHLEGTGWGLWTPKDCAV